MNRRRLLKGAAAAAASLVVAGSLTQRDIREAEATQLIGETSISEDGAVKGINYHDTGYGVEGIAFGTTDGDYNNIGVAGYGTIGVYGEGFAIHYDPPTGLPYGVGVKGLGDLIGVRGESTKGNGVEGHVSWGAGNGVLGTNTDGVAVTGIATGEGHGVVGQVSGAGVGVIGRNVSGGSAGVKGEGGFAGVRGESTKGYGGYFQGVKAQLMLKPKGGTAGKPTTGTHAKGEISMDSAATLWVCTRGGTPGTWRKVTTTAT
jgi:hypothetical protein